MTPILDSAIASLLTVLRNVEDPVERYAAIRRVEGELLAAFRSERSAIASELHQERSWAQVGSMLGVTGSRAEQISRAAR